MNWEDRNPFTEEFMVEEVKFYAAPNYDQDGVQVTSHSITGVCDDYLNRAYRTGSVPMPILTIDGKLWMSISYLEVQSHYLPIQFAEGVVGTAGLGLGYYTLRVMAKPEVEKVYVFEREQRIVDFFKDAFSDREGFEKVKFVVGDAHEKLRGYELDFLYVDTYKSLLSNEVITDAKLYHRENNLGSYHFWGQERVFLDAILLGYEFVEIPYHFGELFRMWCGTPIEGFNDEMTLDRMWRAVSEGPEYESYCEAVIDALDS